MGIGIGLVVGQLPNLILSGVEAEEASEASGLQGTAQNLGMALGTAVVGTVILSVSLASIASQVDSSTMLTPAVRAEIEAALDSDLDSAGTDALEETLRAAPPEVQDEALRIFTNAQVKGFQAAIFAGAAVALLGAILTFRLPKVKLEGNVLEETVRSASVAGMQLEMEDL